MDNFIKTIRQYADIFQHNIILLCELALNSFFHLFVGEIYNILNGR